MAYIRIKNVPYGSDNYYRYLVKGDRHNNQVKQKVIKYLGPAKGPDDRNFKRGDPLDDIDDLLIRKIELRPGDQGFANERGKPGIHLGDEGQYQHSRFRCPECMRGMAEHDSKLMCRLHGSHEEIRQLRDDDRGYYDTNDPDDLKEFIDSLKVDQDKTPSPEEKEKFGDKTMEQSWHDYFNEKKRFMRGYMYSKERIKARGLEAVSKYDQDVAEENSDLKGVNVAINEEIDEDFDHKDWDRFKDLDQDLGTTDQGDHPKHDEDGLRELSGQDVDRINNLIHQRRKDD